MTYQLGSNNLLEIEVYRGEPPSVSERYGSGTLIQGLQERVAFAFAVHKAAHARVFIDDIEIYPRAGGRYEWTPSFIAGRVEVVICQTTRPDAIFHLEVDAAESKLAAGQYDLMADEIQRHRAALLLDNTAALREFGTDAQNCKFEALIRLARLYRYAPAFLKQVEKISFRPHKMIQPISRSIPLAQVKRLTPASLRDPRIAHFANDPAVAAESLSSTWVNATGLMPTFDSPSNRALKSLMTRMAAQISTLMVNVQQGRLGGDKEEQEQRRPYREQQLQHLLKQINGLLRAEPFSSVSRVETTAASLIQISAQPEYSSAYRNGMRALWLGFEGSNMRDHLPVKPTWGIYEAWCFVRLLASLSQRFDGAVWKSIVDGAIKADESYTISLGGANLELHFQASFSPVSSNTARQAGWSLSRQRYPDIIAVLRQGDHSEFVVLDAKYRRHRSNVLDAMESAHIYHDSLRIGTRRPEFCALLLPAEADVIHLEDADFLTEHRVGTISEFCPDGKGVDRCMQLIMEWAGRPAFKGIESGLYSATQE